MLKYVESFGHYSNVGQNMTTVLNQFDTGWSINSAGGGSVTIDNGFDPDISVLSRSVRMTRNVSTYANIGRTFTSVDNIVILGFEFRATGRGKIMRIADVLDIDWPDSLSINGATGTATVILNTVYHVELQLNKATKECKLKLNGFDFITTTLDGGVVIPDALDVIFGWSSGGQSAVFNCSNVSFVDGSAGKYTSFIGPKAMISYPPTESVEPIEWTPWPESMTNEAITSAIPANMNRYTKSNVIGAADYYKSNHLIEGDIAAVAVSTLISKTDIDPQKVAIGISDGTADKKGTDIDVQVQATYYQSVFETDSTNTDWTAQTATSVEFGVTIQPN